ncbi:MAG: hypothetical protein ACSLFP_14730 [Acidimicrobiales bacterium]
MRLLSLSVAGEEVALHPLVSVVPPSGRSAEAIRSAVAGLARAEALGDGGLLEAHGVRFDLRSDLLAMLDIDGSILPIVERGDVPSRPDSPEQEALREAEQALRSAADADAGLGQQLAQAEEAVRVATMALDDARRTAAEAQASATRRIEALDELAGAVDRITERRRQVGEELESARAELRSAEHRRQALEGSHADVRDRRAEATRRREELAAELAEVEEQLVGDAEAAVEEATEAVRAVEAEVAAERAAEAERAERSAADPPEERLAAVDARLEDLDREMAALTEIDRAAVHRALGRLTGDESVAMVPDPRAEALAQELAALQAVVEVEVGSVRPLVDPVRARAHLDEARQALLEAEQALRNPDLDPVQVAQLEEVHADLLDALDKADSRFGGARAQRRVAELRARESELLDELGFATYSDHMMGASSRPVDPALRDALTAARADLADAEATWRRVSDQTDQELARAEALDRRRTLLDRAEGLLGSAVGAQDAVAALRSHRVPSLAPETARADLAEALEGSGVSLEGAVPHEDDLVVLAEGLLEEAALADERRSALEAEQRALVDERRELQALLARAEGQGDEDSRHQRDWTARLELAQAALADARGQAQAQAEAQARRPALLHDLDDATEVEVDAVAAAAEADGDVAAAAAAEELLRSRVVRLDEEQGDLEVEEREANERMRALSADGDAAIAQLAAAVDECSRALAEATAARDTCQEERDAGSEVLAAATSELDRRREAVAAEGDATTGADEVEWYLLARLAGQRAVSLAGGLPLVIDGALRGLDRGAVRHILDRLARMAETVQIIVVSDDPAVEEWAAEVGVERAAVVAPAA